MLVVFDLDGTLIRSFLREGAPSASFDDVEPLPGRIGVLQRLRRDGHHLAVATNQGGVAHGYQTQAQVWNKIARVRHVFWLPYLPVWAAFAHAARPPVSAAPAPGHSDWPCCDLDSRKPGPGMILAAIAHHRTVRQATVMVGDMDSDRQAAEAADVRYFDAEDYFG